MAEQENQDLPLSFSEDEKVQRRASQVSRGAVYALFGYVREVVKQLKQEAETGVRPPMPELVELRLPPSAVEEIEKMLKSQGVPDEEKTEEAS